MLKKDEILNILKENYKPSDTIFIHSSLKSIGEIEGGPITLIESLKEYFSDGLVIFPTHTWDKMKEDNQVLDLDKPNSCVGALTNIALESGFIRSFHPTHSVCAYGKNAKDYIRLDDVSKTPVSPNGCIGSLSKIGAKILFIGVPLSKNTFVHSLEERYNVCDRFTPHIYHFYSKKGDKVKEFFMPKHYSSLNPHISDNYLKLEKPFLEYPIARLFKLGNAKCMTFDALSCDNFVSYLLEHDIHTFDNDKEIDDKLIRDYRILLI